MGSNALEGYIWIRSKAPRQDWIHEFPAKVGIHDGGRRWDVKYLRISTVIVSKTGIHAYLSVPFPEAIPAVYTFQYRSISLYLSERYIQAISVGTGTVLISLDTWAASIPHLQFLMSSASEKWRLVVNKLWRHLSSKKIPPKTLCTPQ